MSISFSEAAYSGGGEVFYSPSVHHLVSLDHGPWPSWLHYSLSSSLRMLRMQRKQRCWVFPSRIIKAKPGKVVSLKLKPC